MDTLERIPTIREIIDGNPLLIEQAAQTAESLTDVLSIIGLSPQNTRARKMIKRFLAEKGIPLPVYKAKYRQPPADRLSRFVEDSPYVGGALRLWVRRDNLISYACSGKGCPLEGIENPTWAGKEITLDLDHANGINTDNRLENLRFLCPNCHSQTSTYKSKNRRKEALSTGDNANHTCPSCQGPKSKHTDLCHTCQPPTPRENNKLCSCGKDKSPRAKKCVTCHNRTCTKTQYPPLDELVEQVSKLGYTVVGSQLGVSGNAVKKYLSSKGEKDVSKFSHNKD